MYRLNLGDGFKDKTDAESTEHFAGLPPSATPLNLGGHVRMGAELARAFAAVPSSVGAVQRNICQFTLCRVIGRIVRPDLYGKDKMPHVADKKSVEHALVGFFSANKHMQSVAGKGIALFYNDRNKPADVANDRADTKDGESSVCDVDAGSATLS